MTIKLRTFGWELAGRRLPWLWGQIFYWDLERSRWHDVLRACRQTGQEAFSTAVLPRVHQLEPGKYDFKNPKPQQDLSAFLSEAQAQGLKVFVWLGPCVLPGVAAAGYPEDWLRQEDALARGPEGERVLSERGFGGEVFSLPCLVNPWLSERLDEFAGQLGPVLAPFLHPDGPVIGLGFSQAPGWNHALAPFQADYHPEAVRLYRDFLRKQHGSIKQLNQAYQGKYANFSEVEPPKAAGPSGEFPSPWLLDWAHFREEYFARAAENLHSAFAPVGQERVPCVLSTIPTTDLPNQLVELERSRCFDLVVPELPGAQAGSLDSPGSVADLAFSARCPIQPRAYFDPGDSERLEYQVLKALAEGIRGWDALAAAGSGALPGFITDRNGSPRRPGLQVWENLRQLAQSEGFWDSQRYSDFLLLRLPEMERSGYLRKTAPPRWDLLEIASEPPAPVLVDEATSDYFRRFEAVRSALSGQGYAFFTVQADTAWDRLSRSPLLVVPSIAAMSSGVQARLVQCLESGTSLVLLGALPVHPVEAKFTPLAEQADVKPRKGSKSAKGKAEQAGRLFHVEDDSLQKLFRILQQQGVPRPVTVDHPGLRVSWHKHRNRIFIGVVNEGPETIETVVRREGKFVLKAFWKQIKFLGGNNEIKVSLPPRSARLWELIPC